MGESNVKNKINKKFFCLKNFLTKNGYRNIIWKANYLTIKLFGKQIIKNNKTKN